MPTTTHYGLAKFVTSASNWGNDMNNNLDAIDAAIFANAAGSSTISVVASATISAYLAVALIAAEASPADNATSGVIGNVVGIALAGTASGASCPIQIAGPVIYNGWSWTVGSPVFLGSSGHLTQTPPVSPSALFSQVIGIPVSSDTLLIQLQAPIALA